MTRPSQPHFATLSRNLYQKNVDDRFLRMPALDVCRFYCSCTFARAIAAEFTARVFGRVPPWSGDRKTVTYFCLSKINLSRMLFMSWKRC